MKFKIFLSKSALSQLNLLDIDTQERIKGKILALRDNPYQNRAGADIKRLVSVEDPPLFRLRIGDYRVIYFIVKDEVKITKIIHRSKGYKWLN